jgi:hypothetical protein
VSPDVAAKLDAQRKVGAHPRLAPQEWRSGRELRVIEAIGPAKEIQSLVAKLRGQIKGASTKGEEAVKKEAAE